MCLETDKPLSCVWRDDITVQVAVATKSREFSPEQPCTYALFFNGPGMPGESPTRRSIARSLAKILAGAAPSQGMYFYLHDSRRLSRTPPVLQ